MPTLLPHAFAVVSGPDILLLDVRADDYAIVPDAVAIEQAGSPLHPLGVSISPEAVATLIEAGLADGREGSTVPPLERPTGTIVRDPDVRQLARPRDLIDLVQARREARGRLGGTLPFRSFARERSRPQHFDGSSVARAMNAIDAARLLVPTPRRCLPASLICSLFLARRGIASEIVFGVRRHPFLAHCWVEVGGALVDDDADRVGAYLPICVART